MASYSIKLGRAVLLLVLLGFTVAHLAAQSQSVDDKLFQQAMAAMQSGQFAQARALLTELRVRHPHDFPIDESLGLACAQLGDMKSALSSLLAATQENPSSAVAQANLGTAYLKLHQNQSAIHALEASARLDPSNVSTQVALGQAYMLVHQPAKAASAFHSALQENSADPTLLYNAALADYQSGRAAQAEPLLDRMPGGDSSAEAQSLFGDVDESLGKFEDAAKHYANAANLDPSEANVFTLGIDFLRHWTFEAAIKEFNAGIQQFPKSMRMRLGLGVAYYGGSYYDKALPVFSALLRDDPENALYAELLGRICVVQTEGNHPECSVLVAFAQRHPNTPMIATYAAISILHQPAEQQNLTTARTLLLHALQQQPHMPQAQFAMGFLLQQEGRWPQSIPYLKSAIREKPDYFLAHYRLALAYTRSGDKQLAEQEIKLERRYSNADHTEVENRLRSVTTFLVNMQ